MENKNKENLKKRRNLNNAGNINNSVNKLNKKDKLDILKYIGISVLAIIGIVVILYALIFRFKKNKEEKVKRMEQKRVDVSNIREENTYINKRSISKNELYTEDYEFNAINQMAKPRIGEYILDLKFEGYDNLKFKIFLPNTPSLGLDLEKAVKDGNLIGKQIENWRADSKIYINQMDSEKIWSVHSKENLDLKLVPFYGALVVNTEGKKGDENYKGGFGIIVNKEDETKELKSRKYPKQLIELSKKYKGNILDEYSNNSVIGQLIEGEETLEKIKEDINKKIEYAAEEKINISDLNNIKIEDAKFYQYQDE